MLDTEKIKCTIYTEDPNGITVLSKEDVIFLEYNPFLEDVNLRAKVRPIGFHTRAHCENMQKNITGKTQILKKNIKKLNKDFADYLDNPFDFLNGNFSNNI